MTARDKRVEKAQTRVIFTVPFFAPGVAKLPVTFDPSVPTACTDGVGIRWNPDWFDKLTDPQLVTVLVHETAHCLLGHIWRAPDNCDWDIWNQATDHAVNLMLKEFAGGVTGKGLADPFPFPDPQDAYCANPAFKGMAEEVIYSRLLSSKPPGGGGKGSRTGQGGSGGMQTPPGQGKGQGGGKGAQSGPSPGKPGPGSMPSFGQMANPDKASPSSDKKLQNDWGNTLLQSAKLGQGQGTLPCSMQRLIGQMVNPQINWWDLLRSWLREQVADDWNWLEPAMEYEGSGFILPSLKSEKCGPVVFATDTSGSIDETMLARFQAEKQNCLDELRPKTLVDIYCDARIQRVAEYSPGDTIKKQCPGGGGTDFRPVFEHVRKLPETVKAVVYLTDLYGSFPERDPGVPVIWVTWTKGTQAPFGQTIYAGE